MCVCARKTGAKMVSICALSAQNFLRLRRAYQASGGACGEPKNRDFTRHWITRTADPAGAQGNLPNRRFRGRPSGFGRARVREEGDSGWGSYDSGVLWVYTECWRALAAVVAMQLAWGVDEGPGMVGMMVQDLSKRVVFD